MNRWSSIGVTSAGRPVPLSHETDIAVQNGIGLYEGSYKVTDFQNGRLYLTSHRLCYVDNDVPRERSVSLSLSAIESISYYGRFLRSSPKISINLSSSSSSTTKNTLVNKHLHHSPPTPMSAMTIASWICPICYYSNSLSPSYVNGISELPVCMTCGIPAPQEVIDKAIAEVTTTSTGDNLPPTSKRAPTICPRCTFENHPSLYFCEMCNAKLKDMPATTSTVKSNNNNNNTSGTPQTSSDLVKLSFRSGGDKSFYSSMKKALEAKAWNNDTKGHSQNSAARSRTSTSTTPNKAGERARAEPQFGIHALQQAGQTDLMQRQNVLTRSLDDLQNLMASAQELVKLAEKYRRHLESSNSMQSNRALIESSQALGLNSSPMVSKSMTKDSKDFYAELARELADFLSSGTQGGILAAEGGVVTLVDLFAIYNRARGISLVSPQDLFSACDMFEELRLPVRLRKFHSGLLVVQEAYRTPQLVIRDLRRYFDNLEPWKSDSGVTAQDVSTKFGWSLLVAQEELYRAEEEGVLCRDEHISGTFYFENKFMSIENNK